MDVNFKYVILPTVIFKFFRHDNGPVENRTHNHRAEKNMEIYGVFGRGRIIIQCTSLNKEIDNCEEVIPTREKYY